MTRFMISLQDEEKEALQTLAKTERRHPRAQAAFLIRQGLEQCGLRSAEKESKTQIEGGQNVYNN